jgi:hypothetical protein
VDVGKRADKHLNLLMQTHMPKRHRKQPYIGKDSGIYLKMVAFWSPFLESKKPPKQQCRIEGTIFGPNNAALT